MRNKASHNASHLLLYGITRVLEQPLLLLLLLLLLVVVADRLSMVISILREVAYAGLVGPVGGVKLLRNGAGRVG